MCGIAGQIQLRGKKPQKKVVQMMLDALKHRGPSGDGLYSGDALCFGMRRLSIIDVAGGDQPLFNETKDIVIVGNGEIYNYKELQAQLLQRGHKLRTGSDIETVAHLYEESGARCFSKLRGMFALCIYDKRRNLVIISRDRMGEKPLYWTRTAGSLYFASELKSLLCAPGIDTTLDPSTLPDFFSYYSIPEPKTMFSAVKKLNAGAFLTIDLAKGSVEETVYWDPTSIRIKHRVNPTAKIKKMLAEIATLTLRSDVPVGISLSGGLDSAAVLALASKKSTKLKAFSVGYAGRPASDERQKAAEIARQFGIEHIEREISVSEMVAHFPHTVYWADDPIADLASYSIFAVAQLARDHGVPVLLGGIGGDELFWGYPWMQAAARSAKSSQYRQTSVFEASRGFRYGRMLFSWLKGKSFQDSNSLPQTNWRVPGVSTDRAYGKMALDAIRTHWLQNDCIALGDRMSMAASVELRLPLLDWKLATIVYEHEQTVTAFTRDQKYFLKAALHGILPQSVLLRKKQGFSPPAREWLTALLGAYLPLLVHGELSSRGFLDSKRIQLLVRVWRFFPFFWNEMYSLIVLEMWMRIMVGHQDPEQLSVHH